ncbi:hypothetical protein SAMN05444266_1117 [Chitinophaga jiangningensis]|uniref:Integral membrane protein n=1 Tax=Chitinophaga jiangningensis TaxID=1419482 RepID=A0A1M7LJV4_9BACT|nr:hypothetical protein [Chitinophaga jiangningensis]SHM78295.1 hypothetical protein SAMN05444266_1117 [Chitinophaga jiangningensis]
MNILAYLIYLSITWVITVQVGWLFYRNGRVFILHFFNGDAQTTDAINRILLTGYYLLNLGYATLMISTWDALHNWLDVMGTVAQMTGRIMLTLGAIHCMNMLGIYLLGKRNFHLHK